MMDTPKRERVVDELVRRGDKAGAFASLQRKIEPTDNKRLIHTDHGVDYRLADVHAEKAGRGRHDVTPAAWARPATPSCLGQRLWSRRMIKSANLARRDRPAEAGS